MHPVKSLMMSKLVVTWRTKPFAKYQHCPNLSGPGCEDTGDIALVRGTLYMEKIHTVAWLTHIQMKEVEFIHHDHHHLCQPLDNLLGLGCKSSSCDRTNNVVPFSRWGHMIRQWPKVLIRHVIRQMMSLWLTWQHSSGDHWLRWWRWEESSRQGDFVEL